MIPLYNNTWRNTCAYKLSGTETFRLSSSKLLKKKSGKYQGWGTNLQNPSDDICRLYIPDGWKEITPELEEKFKDYLTQLSDGSLKRDISIFTEEERATGRIFVQVDQAGAEALIVAYLCQPGNFRELFNVGIKPHVYVAQHIFADDWQKEILTEKQELIAKYLLCPIKDLPKLPNWKALAKAIKSNDTRYFIGKKTCHASNYDMKAPTFAMDVLKESEGKIRLSVPQAGKFLDTYHRLFPEIKRDFHGEIGRELYKSRQLRNLFGFPREFGGPWGENLLKEAYAYVPQSTVGTITNIALTNLYIFIMESKVIWDILNNKHDSYLVQAPLGDELECAKVMKSLIEQDLVSPRGERFKMKSEASIGFNWSKWNSKDNQTGMKEVLV